MNARPVSAPVPLLVVDTGLETQHMLSKCLGDIYQLGLRRSDGDQIQENLPISVCRRDCEWLQLKIRGLGILLAHKIRSYRKSP